MHGQATSDHFARRKAEQVAGEALRINSGRHTRQYVQKLELRYYTNRGFVAEEVI
jgi:hypothetical protein